MLPNIRKILYNTDLSDNAGYAFRYAVYLAKKTGAEVHVMQDGALRKRLDAPVGDSVTIRQTHAL